MKQVFEKLDLGGVRVASLQKAQDNLAHLMARAQQAETELVALKVQVLDSATDLRDQNQRVLAGMLSRYGANSEQYKQAGGTRKSEKKRPVRKPRTAPKPAPAAAPTLQIVAGPMSGASQANGHDQAG